MTSAHKKSPVLGLVRGHDAQMGGRGANGVTRQVSGSD